MKKAVLVCMVSLMALPTIAFAGKNFRDMIIKANAGKPLIGVNRNRGNSPCIVAVENGGVYVNFKNTNLTDGIHMPWSIIKKVLDYPNVVGYTDKDNSVCNDLNNGKCSTSSQGILGIEYQSESGQLLQGRYVNEFGTIDKCRN